MNRIIFLFLLLSCIGFSTCDVYSEIKELKNGQQEIKDMMKEILLRSQSIDLSEPATSPEDDKGSNSSGTKEWSNSGGSIVSASKTTFGDSVRLQIEVSFSEPTVTYWGVDGRIIGVNEKNFGTTTKALSNTSLFILEVIKSVKFVYFVIHNKDEMVTEIRFDTEGDDGTIKFDNPITCQSSFSKISDFEYDSFYRCDPELDPRDDWNMEVGMYVRRDNGMLDYINAKEHIYVNVTYERNSTAKATVLLSCRTIEREGDLFFLQSYLSIPMRSVIKSLSQRAFYDISKRKIMNKFNFLDQSLLIPKVLKGDMATVSCEAFGRNLPTMQVERNGTEIRSSQTTHIIKDTTKLSSYSFVTFLYASREIEGNYSCVIEKDGKKFISPQSVEVKLKPRMRWDLTKILKSKQNQTLVRAVVEGANGVTLNCSNFSWAGDEAPLFHKEKRTKISEWNERLEITYTWRKMNIISEKNSFSSDFPSLFCIAKDKHSDLTFKHTFWPHNVY